MLPLQVGVPGGIELFILFLIAIFLFGVPVVLIAGGLYLYRQTQSESPANEEVEALRREVENLREEIEQLDDEKE